MLGDQINKRLVDKTLLDLRIASNPHLEPEEAEKFAQSLLDKRRALWGAQVNDSPLDREGLDALKLQLKNSSKTIKVK